MFKSKKAKDLFIITCIYVIAFAIGYIFCSFINGIMLKLFVFDIAATIVTFFFSTVLVNSSVYDAYWSLTPMVMSVWLFALLRAFSVPHILLLIVFNIWGMRLTLNWVKVFTDFSYEDWRYRKFRDETPAIFWPIVNFAGIHLMPTLVVFACMLPLFVIAEREIGILSIPGFLIMAAGILLEHLADTSMHKFQNESSGVSVCSRGLWNYSRHPNYLGEITFWLGVYFAMLPYAVEYWYYGIGFMSVAIMFNCVSIPLMEKRQISRRPEYSRYCEETSRLLLRPHRQ